MSFFNMFFGRNSQTDLLLAVLGFKSHDVPRLRDVHTEDDGKKIAIYTRMGGGNRGHWDSYDNEPGPDCPCSGCRAQHVLGRHPLYLHDQDDEFDTTYATYYFRVPDEFVTDVANLHDVLRHGLRKDFGAHLVKTLNRTPTEDDKEQAAYDSEADQIRRLHGTKANGHTFVPYDDSAMESALKLAESNDGELRSCWGILPLKLRIDIDKKEDRRPQKESAYTYWERARINYEYKWDIDEPYWSHCQERFAEKYPKAMKKIAASVERQRRDAA